MSQKRILFLKSHVPGYTRRTKQGGTVQVTSYETHASGGQTPIVKKHPKHNQADGEHYGKVVPPSDLDPAAVGFVARNPHRPERLSSFHPDGRASGHSGQGETLEDVKQRYAERGHSLTDKGHIIKKPAAEPSP